METILTHESTLPLPSDSLKLYTKTWSPPSSTSTLRARLIYLHGFSDHCNAYDAFFRLLALRFGIEIHSFDQRGYGRSVRTPSEKGDSGGTERCVEDIGVFVRSVSDGTTGAEEVRGGGGAVPLFLGGHSMGGALALTFVATGPRELVRRIRGVVLESPFLAQPAEHRANGALVWLGRQAGRLMPKRQMVQKLDSRFMSRDPEVCEAWERDELCHDTGTLESLAGLLDRGAMLLDGKIDVKEGLGEGDSTRVWVGHGTGDRVADSKAVRRWFEELKVADKEMVAYEGWFHKLHAEPGEDRVRFAEDLGRWILERCENEAEGEEVRAEARAKL